MNPDSASKPDDSRTDLAFGKYLLHVLRMMLSDFLPHTRGTMLLVRELWRQNECRNSTFRCAGQI
jgi:hypothetical protein